MSTVDKLFRDKLENHSIPPTAKSWEKVETRISKKNSAAFVLRAAAGIVLLGLLLTLIFSQGDDSAVLATEETIPAPSASSNDEPKAPIDTDQKVADIEPRKTQVVRQRKNYAEKIDEPKATPEPEFIVYEPEQEIVVKVPEIEPVKTKRMVLVYSLPSVSKKVETPAEEEKKTGLQKAMDVAMDVRSSESPLGDLREKKDELFALEFRKDKNKSKNY
jgi:hypothetical protein